MYHHKELNIIKIWYKKLFLNWWKSFFQMANHVLSHVSPARLHKSNWSCNSWQLGANLAMGVPPPPLGNSPPPFSILARTIWPPWQKGFYWLGNGRRDNNEPIYEWAIYLDFKSWLGNYFRAWVAPAYRVYIYIFDLLKNCSNWLENRWRDINEPIFQWVIYLDFKSCPGNILGRGYPPFTLYINTIFKPKKIYHHTNETAGERKEG